MAVCAGLPHAQAGELPDSLKTRLSKAIEQRGAGDVAIELNVKIPMTFADNPMLSVARDRCSDKDDPESCELYYDCDGDDPNGRDCNLWATVMYHTSVDPDTGMKPRPTILMPTAYRREIMGSMRAFFSFLPHGYNVMVVDMRGTGSAGGFWDALGPVEQYDLTYLIDTWIPSQSWSDGTVGMVGGSYDAVLQYLAAGLVEQEYCPEKGGMVPKHLKAITPLSAYSDVYHDIALHGGNFEEEFMAVWIGITDLMTIMPPDLFLGGNSASAFYKEDIKEALNIWKQHANQLRVPIDWIMKPENELKNEWYDLKNPMLYWPDKPKGGWQFSEGIPPEVGGNTLPGNLPVFTATSWFDIFLRGTLNNYQYGLKKQSDSDKAMIIGPWYHIDAAFTFPGINGMGLLGFDSMLTWEILVRWFDWKIKGKSDPFMEKFPVLMYVMGEDRWRAEKSWPLAPCRLEEKTFFLSKKKASWIRGDWFSVSNAANNYKLVTEPTDSDYYTRFLFSKKPKADPVLEHDPSELHGMKSRSSQRWFGFSPLTTMAQLFSLDLGQDVSEDKLFWEDERSDEVGVLTFTTAPLTEDMEISGPMTLTFWARTRYNTHSMTDIKIRKTLATLKEKFDIEGDENLIMNLAEKDDVQWVIEVNDVFPKGRARNITSGWLSSAHRPYDPDHITEVDPSYTAFDPFYDYPDKNPDPIYEDTVYKYVIEIWPTTNVFKKGHRLRVSISASDFPHLFPVLASSTNTIVLDEKHKARLDFTVANRTGEGVNWKWIDQDVGEYLLKEKN